MGKLVISKLNGHDVLFQFNDDHEVVLIKYINNTIVDNIYVGQITEINKGLRAAFVSIGKDSKVFLPLSEFKNNDYKCGDRLLVQIKTDALKTKLPQAGLDICIPGQFVVCHLDSKGISVSKKLSEPVKNDLLKAVKDSDIEGLDEFGWVIRTNAADLLEDSIEPLLCEIKDFVKTARFISNEAQYRTLYSKIYEPSSALVGIISDIAYSEYDAIITDNKEFYDILQKTDLKDSKEIKFHADEYVSLKNLHSLETYLNRALDKKVYLDCGGYLIIEPTEAMTVIDVNSGKAEGKGKDSREYIMKINRQAAVEIARQLKIRNISGMIMVDFISMKADEDNKKIMDILKSEVGKDRVLTNVVDMTPLGIVEITRKKIDIPLIQY